MYLPEVFEETRPEVLWDLVARHPLGLLVTAGPEGPMASPLPFLVAEAEGRLRLTCHLARPNPHLEALAGTPDCLVVFQGAEAYVTPSWYPSKAETERVTPTWNYEMVQVRGVPTLRPERDWLAAHVAALTAAQESRRPAPWAPSDAPADYIESMLRGIVGLEIEITEIRGKWKMSQNRLAQDADGAARGLADPEDPHHDPDVAALVAGRLAARERP
ncbi:FMN-binding negative transcriptional regulator [Phenylobacterium parvum]|uniref:Transcriptional regulator n=1 Tax=Phenylobacterium parvum TaxID=2201350 RepID=A0A2Z3HYQ5_9CAUL|nr:FMN-binding negative transcriptional regulator [Phenylobacterium parvum]AWM76688.1 transcriptional regulator [Phenylobacterium parvum]